MTETIASAARKLSSQPNEVAAWLGLGANYTETDEVSAGDWVVMAAEAYDKANNALDGTPEAEAAELAAHGVYVAARDAERAEAINVGAYRVVHDGTDWRVMEAFGSHRMLRNRWRTMAPAVKRAEKMDAERDATR